MALLDIGKPGEWPGEAGRVVESIAEIVARWPVIAERDLDDPEDDGISAGDLTYCDPEFSADAGRRLRDALAGHDLRSYHASRLLPHEIEWIRAEGLSLLSPELVERKLTGAMDHYPDLPE